MLAQCSKPVAGRWSGLIEKPGGARGRKSLPSVKTFLYIVKEAPYGMVQVDIT